MPPIEEKTIILALCAAEKASKCWWKKKSEIFSGTPAVAVMTKTRTEYQTVLWYGHQLGLP